MNKRFSTFLLLGFLLVGAGLLLYPGLSNYWNSLHQSRAIAGYVESLAQLDEAVRQKLLEEAQAYNRKISRIGTDFSLSTEDLAAYYATFNVNETGILGYIEIERAGCSLPVYHGVGDAVLQVAVGHIPGTSLPVGGTGTHCVLSGHRGLPSAKIFSDLDRLTPGDTFLIRTLNEVLTYEVDQVRIVPPSDVSALGIEPGEDLCTLVTCTPYGVNTHRLLVRGHRVETKTMTSVRVFSEAAVMDKQLAAAIYAIPPLVVLLLWLLIDSERQTGKNAVRKKLNLNRHFWEEGESGWQALQEKLGKESSCGS